MKKTTSFKPAVIGVVILLLAFLGYFFYKQSASTASSSILSQSTPSNGIIGSQVLGLLNQIQSLRIDPAIFKDPAYLTLRDFSVAIPPENVGRTNPFAPLPGQQESKPTAGGSTGH